MPSESPIKLAASKIRRRIFRHYSFIRNAIVALAAIFLVVTALRFLLPVGKLAKDFLFGPVNVLSVIFNRERVLKNDNGRTNILLLGISGVGHDGPNLTDSMMVLSLKTKLNKDESKSPPPVTLISIPRDIYFDSLQNKINFAYQAGVDKGVGAVLVKGVVSEVTGLPVHYAVVADFSAFDDVIDILGGIDVNVEHTLDDFGYPIDGKENDTCGYLPDEIARRAASITISPASEIAAFPCRYEHLHFDIGLQHMSGVTALKFARSRHAEGEEGTDFARSRRQQLILKAIKDKSLSQSTLLNPQKILDVYTQIKGHISSDLDSSEINSLINLALKYRTAQIRAVAIDQSLLDNPPVDQRGWILLPSGGTWDQVHEFVKKQLENQ